MADFYEKFFNAEGPGVVVYSPDNTRKHYVLYDHKRVNNRLGRPI